MKVYRNYFKRAFDFTIVSLSLIALSPLLLVVMVLIPLESKGPIFFLQERYGFKGKTFWIYKFRSMTHKKREVNQEIMSGNSEVTKIGHFIRRFKIDELPQLINVWKGDMSLVGPRPFMPESSKMLTGDKNRRQDVLPGLTGLAQINGNIYLTWEDRIVYDLEYVDNLSFWLDMKTIARTFLVLIYGEGKFLSKK